MFRAYVCLSICLLAWVKPSHAQADSSSVTQDTNAIFVAIVCKGTANELSIANQVLDADKVRAERFLANTQADLKSRYSKADNLKITERAFAMVMSMKTTDKSKALEQCRRIWDSAE